MRIAQSTLLRYHPGHGAATAPNIDVMPDAEAFLVARPDLHALLRDAADQLGHSFPGAPLRVSLRHNEGQGEPPELVLAAVTDLALADAFARLDRFDEEWWLDAMPRADGLLTVTVKRV